MSRAGGKDQEPRVVPLPPVTRRLLGIARGVDEEDYRRYLEEKYGVKTAIPESCPVRGEAG